MKSKKDDIEQTRIRTKELGNQKKWLNWIEKYGDDLELMHDLSKEDRKEYLEGLLEKIEVRLDKDTNDHHLDIIFKMGLVNDRIEYANPKRKSGKYRVIEGDKNAKLVISHEQTRKMHKESRIAGRRKQNEKNSREITNASTYHRSPQFHYCGMTGFDSKRNTQNTEVFLTFRLSVRASHLWTAPYSEYQQFLYDTITDFREKGWNYQQIADWFNTNDYKTPRGKKFYNSSCHSIVKKKRIRERRSTRRYPPETL